MVFSFIFQALINSQRQSLFLLLLIFVGVTVSNCLALTTAYFFSQLVLPHLHFSHFADVLPGYGTEIELLFSFDFPKMMGTEKALVVGLGGGCLVSFLSYDQPIKIRIQRFADHLTRWIFVFLQKIFMPLLPLYVFGFCLKLSHDNALLYLFQQFGQVFLLSMGLVSCYLFFLYFIGVGGNFKKAATHIVSMLPAGLTGFSTMSSAVAMPVTLNCAEQTTQDLDFVRLIIPSTANIHMLGDDLTIAMTAMALLSIFGLPWPDATLFIPFVMAFSLAKLSCVGVPGASVLVILPVLQNYLGFSSEMASLLTTVYIRPLPKLRTA